MRPTHVRLLVSDMGASYRFYEDVLGLSTPSDETPFDRGSSGIRPTHLRDPDGNLVELNHDVECEHDP